MVKHEPELHMSCRFGNESRVTNGLPTAIVASQEMAYD